MTVPVLLGICQAISANCSGSTASSHDLLCHRQSRKCGSDFKLKHTVTAWDNTHETAVKKNSIFMTVLSTGHLNTILTEIETLVFSENLPELDRILAELNQVLWVLVSRSFVCSRCMRRCSGIIPSLLSSCFLLATFCSLSTLPDPQIKSSSIFLDW